MSAVEVTAFQGNKPRQSSNPSQTIDATGEVLASLTPELVIALCGPIGSPLHDAGKQFASGLEAYGYTTEVIRLSELISMNSERVGKKIDRTSGRLREIKSLIEAGDELRNSYGNDILAKFSIAKIKADREANFGAFKDAVAENSAQAGQRIVQQRVCHVIDSIKNKFELDLLRHVYGDAFLAIGVFSPLEIRIANLGSAGPNSIDSKAVAELIDTDSGEEFSHGQSVRDTFPRCDFFMRVDHSIHAPNEDKAIGQIAEKVRRTLGLVFRTSVITPTPEETAMYAAASASRNSACMSRQVGAAVSSASGELLAVGWNDVPQAGGGLYGKPSLDHINFTTPDDRCFAKMGNRCHNDEEKKGIAKLLGESLVSSGVLSTDKLQDAIRVISDSRVKDLIEFSRAVHAEMHAILGAGRVAGERIIGGKIFVTTYPCHSCARHIVAAGITEVHYIEPYRKSMATKLHRDALTESVTDATKVRLIQFDGVAPRRFIDVFEAGVRKQGGVLSLPSKDSAGPATQVSLKAIPRLEEVVVAELATKQLNLPPVSRAAPAGPQNGET